MKPSQIAKNRSAMTFKSILPKKRITMRIKIFVIVLSLIIVSSFTISSAQVPQMINYQGKLTTPAGAPVNDTLQMVFSIYSDEGGTNLLWTETQPTVEVLKGVFNVLLGNVTPIPYSVFDGSVRYLGVKVGGDPEITPRKKMVSVAYAYKSFEADTADYARAGAAGGIGGSGTTNYIPKFTGSTTLGNSAIYQSGSYVGIGTTSPNEQLQITGNLRLPATTVTAGIIKVGADRFIHNYGMGNTFVGVKAGNLTMEGGDNTANGYMALYSNTTGGANTANGGGALSCNTTGDGNTANGYMALYFNTTGHKNTANGFAALYLNTIGFDNAANGYAALTHNTTGAHNIANGYMALWANTTGTFNTANGSLALYSNTTGYANTANGYDALYSNTTGDSNTANGSQALYSNTTGYHNTANGSQALYFNTTGYHNTANGNEALYSNTTGYQNTANGQKALFNNTTGDSNTATGDRALYSNTTGGGNTANGYMALYSNTTGHENTATGLEALYSNTTGTFNTANGSLALNSNTTGYDNTANGWVALASNTTGYQNTADGVGALLFSTDDYNNTAVGYEALCWNAGNCNTALGCNADVWFYTPDLTNATAIGYEASVDASNKVVIGNTDVTSIGGYAGWTHFSRYEKNVSENVPGLAFINKLKPVTYTMDVAAIDAVLRPPRQPHEGQSEQDLKLSAEEMASKQAKSQIVYTGFIAQEVEQAAKEIGYDFSGVDAPKSEKGMYGLRYAEFVVPLVKAVQEQQRMIQEHQQLIQELQKRIEELEKK
jgi:hypothetical protein